MLLRSRAQPRLGWDRINLCEPQISLSVFSLCFKRRKKKIAGSALRLPWRQVCLSLSPGTAALRTEGSPRGLWLSLSGAQLWRGQRPCKAEAAMLPHALGRTCSLWCCPNTDLQHWPKTLHKLQGVKLSPKETLLPQGNTVGPLHHSDSSSILPKHLGMERGIQQGIQQGIQLSHSPTQRAESWSPFHGHPGHSHPVPFCSAPWCLAHGCTLWGLLPQF